MIQHQDIKQRFNIIGRSSKLDRAIEIAIQVAPTDISVLITVRVVLARKPFQKLYTTKATENTKILLR